MFVVVEKSPGKEFAPTVGVFDSLESIDLALYRHEFGGVVIVGSKDREYFERSGYTIGGHVDKGKVWITCFLILDMKFNTIVLGEKI